MLDLKAIIWLENYLQVRTKIHFYYFYLNKWFFSNFNFNLQTIFHQKNWQSTLLIVSHDRSFLNQVAQEILHLHSQKIECYRGNYENFLKTKTENLKNQQREYEAQFEYRQHIQIFIDRFRYNANRAAQVQSKIKMLEKLWVLRGKIFYNESV